MEALHLSERALHTRGGLLDELMDKVFDVSILVDAQCRIIRISRGAYPVLEQREGMVGRHVSAVDNVSPFTRVIETGRPATGLLLELNGRRSVSSLFPIEDGGRIIGVLGTVLFRSLNAVKEIFSGAGEGEVGEIYQNIARSDSGYTFEDFLGESPPARALREQCRRAAGSGEPVLVIGETGTGKEIVAGAIHSARHGAAFAPYITLNCTAIPENLLESELFGHEKGAFTGADAARAGKFELAAGGDILLDEIGDMPPALQGKLLRVLESREFERVGGRRVIPFRAGVISATNRNLPAMSRTGQFRADLYYRLSVLEIFLPPLRSRTQDIPLLVDHFSQGRLRLSPAAMDYLRRRPWPGNVRQLKNAVRRLAVWWGGEQITEERVRQALAAGAEGYAEALGEEAPPAGEGACPTLEQAERAAVARALADTAGNVAQAARILGVSRATLYQKKGRYGL